MKKNYIAPKAEVVSFAKEDVITASGDTVFDWDMPTIDLGGDWVWSEDGGALKM
jgi:hypothetical protein